MFRRNRVIFAPLVAGLCIKDGELSFKPMDFGSLKFLGQVRMLPVYSKSEASGVDGRQRLQQGTPEAGQDGDSVVGYEFQKCGYGKLMWPDGSTFEGFWINGLPNGVGVFRAPEPSAECYEGFWQHDRQTNLCVFRQNFGEDIKQDLDAYESQSELTSN